MPQSKILVDTNAYIRLAKTIRPLLFASFGDNEYCLYTLPELNEELESRKLQSKFHWIEDEEFVENRKHFPSIGRKQKKLIQQTFEYLWDHVQTELPGPSKVDTLLYRLCYRAGYTRCYRRPGHEGAGRSFRCSSNANLRAT